MASSKARVVRIVVAVPVAVGLAAAVYPNAPFGVVWGIAFARSGFGGTDADPLQGMAIAVSALGLMAAPVLLVLAAVRPPRSALGWTAALSFLVVTAASLWYSVFGSID